MRGMDVAYVHITDEISQRTARSRTLTSRPKGRPARVRNLSGTPDKEGSEGNAQGPGDYAAAGQIDHGRQVGPTLPGHDVGDVTGVPLVRARARREVALDQVPSPVRGRVGDGGGPPPLLAAALKPGGAHQPGDPPLPAAAVAAERLMDARRPVRAPGLLMDAGDLRGQDDVGGSNYAEGIGKGKAHETSIDRYCCRASRNFGKHTAGQGSSCLGAVSGLGAADDPHVLQIGQGPRSPRRRYRRKARRRCRTGLPAA